MEQSFVILGTNPSLSFAELYQYLEQNNDAILAVGSSVVIIDNKAFSENAAFILGGIPKSGIIVKEIKQLNEADLSLVLREYIQDGQKFHFGLSFYQLSGDTISQGKIKALGLEIKKLLKQSGSSVRLVESKSGNLSSVDVVKNKLLDKGVELCIFSTDKGYLIGKTQAVQQFEAYSNRDYGRPKRDSKRGMLPPKLARVMVNLAATPQGSLILDPFCGSGTILQEALLLGYQVIGTDISEDAIRDTKQNIEWLLKDHKKELPEHKIDAMDVRRLDESVTEKSVDAIVTECDLGPPLSGGESESKVQSIEKSLSDFYKEALSLMHYALKDEGRAIVAWPYFQKHKLFVSVFAQLSELGWKVITPYPEQYQTVFPLSKRGTLLYGREGQHVFREIIIIEKAD
jgi:tRNA G10  N-methylase Trm11